MTATFLEAVEDFGSDITHNGITKPCLPGAISGGPLQQLQGYLPNAGARVTMLVSDFEALGEVKEHSSILALGAQDFRIAQTERNPMSPLIRLILVEDK